LGKVQVMEDDRFDVNLGTATEITQDIPVVPKVPKKRFVGRKTVEKKDDNPTGIIEDAGAIQSIF
jgi:2-(3-amino-3-carboxypropyl)histidine synthase